MTLKPLNNRILVEPTETVTKTEYGLVLAEGVSEKPTTGIVVIGNHTVKKGDKVLFSKFGYDEVIVDKKTLYVISEQNILGVFE